MVRFSYLSVTLGNAGRTKKCAGNTTHFSMQTQKIMV
jgi:hypothetical protein